MKRLHRLDLDWVHLMLLIALLAAASTVPAQETPAWQRPYSGEEATGPHVLALWSFDDEQPLEDRSGHSHTLKLRGSHTRVISEGRFGGALEVSLERTVNDKAEGAAIAADLPDLTPAGAFTLEMWIRPDAAFADRMAQQKVAFLLDKKYFHYASDHPRANHDYLLLLRHAAQGQSVIEAQLGFGQDSAGYKSTPVMLEAGRWHHIAFAYDGAGQGWIYLDGVQVGHAQHEGRGAVSDGPHPLVIGDRVGSNYYPFPGAIDQVRICDAALRFATGRIMIQAQQGRRVFLRMEQGASVSLTITNDREQPLEGASVRISAQAMKPVQIPLPRLASGERHTLTYPIDTTLRQGRYHLVAQVEQAGETTKAQAEFEVTIVPRPLPHRMPVVMWGNVGDDWSRLAQLGFTHSLVSLTDYKRIWQAGGPTQAQSSDVVATNLRMLDQLLAAGLRGVVYVYPGRWVERNKELSQYLRVDAEGKPYERANLCPRFERVQAFARDVGASVAQTYGHHPALDAALIHSEIRDATQICYHPQCLAAYRQASGQDIPAQATSKTGVSYSNLPGFPADRVVPDDHPLLKFYRWFWSKGDGWNLMHSLVHEGLKSTGREDLWTFYDPAVRVPSLWGSGGEVDVISQWTYTYPDPPKISLAADELFAMAAGRPGQRVMKMTQVIWYRSQTAPATKPDQPPVQPQAAWEQKEPEAKFITISPDHLREALWMELAYPVQGVMYHGWGSLVEVPGSTHAYRYTNPQTQHALAEMVKQVVKPLGPMLMQVPDRPADVAYLESFTSQMLAGRGTYGWSNGWGADAYLILLWAHLQPRVVYEQTIQQEGLDGYRVLVLVDCDVLPRSIVDAVLRFQARGGIVIGDERLCPAIQPDILLPSYRRTRRADQDKAALQACAAALRDELDAHYQRFADSSNPDVLVRARRAGNTDYLFVINDHRTFGSYVGHHRLVMEDGLPAQATLHVRREQGVVYDVLASRQLTTQRDENGLSWDVELEPGQGRLFMIMPRPIAAVRIETPQQAITGQQVLCRVSVVDEQGEPIPAVVPLRIDILDAQGQPAEFSGYYGAVDGQVELRLDVPSNGPVGNWQIRVKDLASSQTAQQALPVVAGI